MAARKVKEFYQGNPFVVKPPKIREKLLSELGFQIVLGYFSERSRIPARASGPGRRGGGQADRATVDAMHAAKELAY